MVTDVLKYDQNTEGEEVLVSCNLDIKNPNNAESLEHLTPQQLAEDILKKEQRVIKIVKTIRKELEA